MKEISTLREHQLRLLALLQQFDTFCAAHQIKYVLVGGSALGAVRHHGFIPWDDDVDVGMSRNSLNYLEELVIKQRKSIGENTYFESCDVHKVAHPPFAFLSSTQPYNAQGKKIPCIDIFPFDGVPENKLLRKIQQFFMYLYHLSVLQKVPKNRGKLAAFIVKMVLAITPEWLWNKIERVSRKVVTHWNYETSDSIANVFGMAGFQKEIMPKAYIGEGVMMNFENQMFPIPEQYDAYLTHLFGDYMTPPPEKDRHPKHEAE